MTDQSTETRAGASELLRSLDLLVDGPARWGSPVNSRKAGVFIVELPGGAPTAPIDGTAVRRWIERVPELMLDGERPSPQELGRWLANLWLPNEPILFVGRSAKGIGARVSAMQITTLGDSQPYSGGHWLKALSVATDLRVWWAETDAHEEYEDAVLDTVARRSGGLPFANLARQNADARTQGLVGSLRAADPASKSAVTKTARPTAGRAPAATRVPRPKTLRGAAARPAVEPTYVSADGLAKLNAELEELRINVRPQVIARVKAARELGDLKENADYEYARKEQSFVEGRILSLEAMIKTSVIIDESGGGGSARLGSTVLVDIDGDKETYLLVGPAEADPVAGRISNLSPVGRALIGSRAGDEVAVQLPARSVTYRVLEVR